MRVFVSADIEGITGITSRTMLDESNEDEYTVARKLMTREVNHVIDASFAAGASEVLVLDGHGSGNNLMVSEFDSRAQLLQKDVETAMMTGVEDCDIVLFVGYHGMASKERSFCAHTNSTRFVQKLYINDVEVSEGHTNALYAKYLSKKVVYANGTDVCIDELKQLIPRLHTTVNLHSLSYNQARSEPLPQHYQQIRNDVINAVLGAKSVEQINLSTAPVRIRIELKYPLKSFKVFSEERGNTIVFEESNIADAYRKYRRILHSLSKHNTI